MLAEQVQEWTAEWVAEGREQGIEQGRAEERALLCRMAARKFGAATAQRLADALAEVADTDRLGAGGRVDHRVRDRGRTVRRFRDARPGD